MAKAGGRSAASDLLDQSAGHRPVGRRRGWIWVLVAVALAVFKAEAWITIVDHRGAAIALLGALLIVTVLRIRLVWVAISTGALCGVLLSAHSFIRGLGVGAAVFAVVLAAFFVVSTVLRRQQARRSTV